MASAFETRCSSFEEFQELLEASPDLQSEMEGFEHALLMPTQFNVAGQCAVCEAAVAFGVDFQWSFASRNGQPVPNWRESLACPKCHLNNRMRASAAYLLANSGPDDAVFLTEMLTPLFTTFERRRPYAIGSEFLGPGTPSGTINEQGVRHEDVARLSFADGSLGLIGTFDVLEHVPAYTEAMSEFFRCLWPGGMLVATVPFDLFAPMTVTRAKVDADGNVTHFLEPEIHGNPIDPAGSLCYYNHGWEFVDRLRDAGFVDAGVTLYWNPDLGYLGSFQSLITGRKPV